MVVDMDKKDKNIVDKFLDLYEKEDNYRYKKIYVRPSKFKSIVGFIFSLIFLILLFTLFTPKPIYFVLLLGDLLIVLYYGCNLFTKNGIGLPKKVLVYEDDEEYTKKENRYKVQ